MDLTPEQLRSAIGRNTLRSILAAVTGVVTWAIGWILIAKFAPPLDRSWMLPLTAVWLIGGLCAMIVPVYLVNRRLAPQCPACREYLTDESIADLGECPRCHAKLFD